MNEYAAIIRDRMNVIIRVEERPTEQRAIKAGQFWTKRGGWFTVAQGREVIDMFKQMINL